MKKIALAFCAVALTACQNQAEITESVFTQACLEQLVDMQEDLDGFEIKSMVYERPSSFDVEKRRKHILEAHRKDTPKIKSLTDQIEISYERIETFDRNHPNIEDWSEETEKQEDLLHSKLYKLEEAYGEINARRFHGDYKKDELAEIALIQDGDKPRKLGLNMFFLTDSGWGDSEAKVAYCTKYAYRGFYEHDDKSLKRVSLVIKD